MSKVSWTADIVSLTVTRKLSLGEILEMIINLQPAELQELIIETLAQDDDLAAAVKKWLEEQ